MISLHFFSSEEFEEQNSANPEDNALKTARNALRLLMMGWKNDWKKILSPRVFKAIFLERDRELVKGMRLAFQEGFTNLFQQLKDRQLAEDELQQVHFYLANCLSLLPFADITPYEYFIIPQYIDNQWRQVTYRVTPIELTPTTGFEQLFIYDEDRVFAYGLEPVSDMSAVSHLIYMGTTYPSGQGGSTQIYTDLKAFETPGDYLLNYSYKKIEQWVNLQQKVHVCGMSLGGSMALKTACYMGEKLSRVDALNPAGCYKSWQENQFDRWKAIKNKPEVYIQKQGNDPVSAFGVWEDEWTVLHVIPPKEVQGPNSFVDHALNYAGFSETQFKRLNTRDDNKEREQRNFWLFTLARSIIFYTVIAPFRYALLPSARYIATHKMLITGTVIALGLFFLLPFALPTFLGTALLLAAITPITINLAYGLYQIGKAFFGANRAGMAALHDPKLPRNETMDIYKTKADAVFTNQDISDYNKAQEILGNKNIISNRVENNDPLELVNNDIYCMDTSNSKKCISASIATINDIRTKVHIMNRFSFYGNSSASFRDEQLRAQDTHYKQGMMGVS